MPLPDKLKRLLVSPALQFAARLIVGGLFIYASLDKIAQPLQFAKVVESYQLLPIALVTLPALILPWVELFAGICLVSGIAVRSAAILLSALLVFFIVILGFNAWRGVEISCGCFSTKIGESENIPLLIVRDLLILIPGLVIVLFSRENKKT